MRILAVLVLTLLATGAGRVRAGTPGAPEDRFARLWVQSPAGRPEPMDTYASELLRKIHHRDRYGDLDASGWLLKLLANPEAWSEIPLIHISHKPLRERFADGGKSASFGRFFDSHGRYVLQAEVEEAYSKPPAERNRDDKELIKLDEKVNVFHDLWSGRILPILPTGGVWRSPGDDLSGLESGEAGRSQGAERAFERTLAALRAGDRPAAASALADLAEYQEGYAGLFRLDSRRKAAEIFYNRADIFRRAFRAYLVLGFLLAAAVMLPERSWARMKRAALVTLTLCVAAVFLWHTFGIGLRAYVSARVPWTSAYETMVFVAWTTILAGLFFARRTPPVLALAALMGGVVLFVSNLNWLDPQITPLVPVLRSPWLMIHVSVITASYGFFGISALCGAGSLCGILAGRKTPGLRTVNEISMIVGLVLLTAGIFFGAIWANESWGRYWGWDPKETWALVTMLVYAFVVHSRFIPRLNNGYAFSVMSVAAVYAVLMTFFGVNYLLSGLHSYGHSDGLPLGLVGGVTAAIALLAVAAGFRYRKQAAGG